MPLILWISMLLCFPVALSVSKLNYGGFLSASDRMKPCVLLEQQSHYYGGSSRGAVKKGRCQASPKDSPSCVWPNCRRGCRSDHQCPSRYKCCYTGCNTFACSKPVFTAPSNDMLRY